MLFKPEAFEPLTETQWDAARARDGIRRIVADVDAAFDVDKLWPADEWDGWQAPTPMKNLYVGAAGVILALDMLRRRGDADTQLDLAAAALQTLAAVRDAPDFMAGERLHAAESALLRARRGSSSSRGASARARISSATCSSSCAQTSTARRTSSCGALRARCLPPARWRTGPARAHGATQSHESADALSRRRAPTGCGRSGSTAANSAASAPPTASSGMSRPSRHCSRRNAREGDRGATCARGSARGRPRELAGCCGRSARHRDGEIRVQWCAGAPGIVTSAATYLDEELLLAGAELPWRTGPARAGEGPGICHGTAGNGYAFLKTFARTGDELWLDRARRFAMHALEQVERRGRGRYSLWTGDLGVALFAADCLDARTAYPVLETWD